MDIKDILESLTPDDIISIMESLGAELSSRSNEEYLIFTSICHESSLKYKLYYYLESKNFFCYSNCGSIGSLLNLLIHINNYEIIDGIKEIKRFFNIGNETTLRRGFRVKKKYTKPSLDDIEIEVLKTPENKPYIYTIYPSKRIKEWESEGISNETIKKFDIRYDDYNEQIIIPHFDINNRIVGIRTRQMIHEKIERYGKYCPLYADGNMYNHQLGKTFYGINKTADNIKKYKKCIILEGEKGVLQLDTLFSETNIGVAMCGSSLSLYQKKIIVDIGVKEVLFCTDKQYQNDNEKDMWVDKVSKMSEDLIDSGIIVYALFDDVDGGLLDYKDSPTDRGIEAFNKLVNKKIRIGEIK